MKLEGLTVNFLGDSITEGVGVSKTENRYTDVFGALTGARVNNYGISGTRIAKKRVPTVDNPRHDLDFISRIDELDENADITVVFGGTNDFGHGDAPMGSMNSRDPYTFYGACHTLMSQLAEKFCGKIVVFMTPLRRQYFDDTGLNSMGHSLEEYVNIIIEVAAYYSIPVLDLYRMSGIAPQIPKHKEELIPDGLHPGDKGAKIVAERLKGFLESL